MVTRVYTVKPQSHFTKKRPTADEFEAKIELFGRQAAVHKPLSLSISTIFVGRPFMSLSGQVINFPVSVADFLR